jgi:hypothetical protein
LRVPSPSILGEGIHLGDWESGWRTTVPTPRCRGRPCRPIPETTGQFLRWICSSCRWCETRSSHRQQSLFR